MKGEKIMQIHENLEQLRKKHNKSQSDIAEVLNTTQQQYWKYEKGKQELPIRHIIKLAEHYHITTDELLGIKKIKCSIPNENYYILELYNKLSEKRKGKAERYLEELTEQQETEKL